jgi:hypothetical protein
MKTKRLRPCPGNFTNFVALERHAFPMKKSQLRNEKLAKAKVRNELRKINNFATKMVSPFMISMR